MAWITWKGKLAAQGLGTAKRRLSLQALASSCLGLNAEKTPVSGPENAALRRLGGKKLPTLKMVGRV
jgi:hypothetical protein